MTAPEERRTPVPLGAPVVVPWKPEPIRDESRALERTSHRFQIGIERPVEERVDRVWKGDDQDFEVEAR